MKPFHQLLEEANSTQFLILIALFGRYHSLGDKMPELAHQPGEAAARLRLENSSTTAHYIAE